jgi:hypothetical protein
MSNFLPPPVFPPNPMFSDPFFRNQPQILQDDKMAAYFSQLQSSLIHNSTSQIPLRLAENPEAAKGWGSS